MDIAVDNTFYVFNKDESYVMYAARYNQTNLYLFTVGDKNATSNTRLVSCRGK